MKGGIMVIMTILVALMGIGLIVCITLLLVASHMGEKPSLKQALQAGGYIGWIRFSGHTFGFLSRPAPDIVIMSFAAKEERVFSTFPFPKDLSNRQIVEILIPVLCEKVEKSMERWEVF